MKTVPSTNPQNRAATERLLRAVVDASHELLTADMDAGLRRALRALGEGTGLDRVYAVRYDHAARAGFFVAEHCAPGIASVTAAMGAGPYGYTDYEEVWRPLLAGEVYTSPVAAKTGANAELNQALGTKSDLFVPVFVGGVFWGTLGFDDCTTERVYCEAEIQVLRAAAALAAALGRAAAEAALYEAETESRMRIHRWFDITGEGAWRARIDPPVPVTLPVDEQVRLIIAGGVLIDCNEIGAVMMGYVSAADWIGHRATEFFPANPANLAYLSAFVAGGHRIRDYESNDGAPDGRDRWFLNNLNGILHEGALVGLYGTHRDITPLKLADAQTRRLERERADEAMALSHLLEGVVAASRALLDEPDFQSGLGRWLAALAAAVDADRAILGRFAAPDDSAHVAINQISWTLRGGADLSQVPIPATSDFVAWTERLQRGESVWAHRDELVDALSVRYREAIDCFTSLIVPVVMDRRTVAWLCFEWRARREWKPAYGTLLRTAADGAAAAIKRNEAVRAMLAEREWRAADLAAVNRELEQRNRLLAASARASALLSAREDFDAAVVEAMGVVAEAAGFDRIVHVEHLDAHGNPGAEFWRVTHEWHRPDLPYQREPGIDGGRITEAPAFFAEMLVSERVIEFTTPEIPDESIRREHENLGVRLMVAGNIFIDGFSWGCFECVDCRTDRRRTEEEKGVIAAAARAIGQAIHRRRLEHRTEALASQILTERESAARARADELAKANQIMRRVNERLSGETNYRSVLGLLLAELSSIVGNSGGGIFTFDANSYALRFVLGYEDGQIVDELVGHPHGHADRPADARVFLGWTDLTTRPAQEFIKMTPGNAAHPSNQWHSRRRHRLLVRTPLIANEEPVGTLCLAFTDEGLLDPLKLELCNAVAQQATLALQLARLSDQAHQADVARERETTILQERTRFAGQIHDTLAQGFTGTLLHLEALRVRASRGERVTVDELQGVRKIAALGLAEARRSALAIRPLALDGRDLSTALQQLTERSAVPGLLDCRWSLSGIPRPLSSIVDEALLNMAHEAVSNAIRHAEASNIHITLAFDPDGVSLRVEDDGIGFDASDSHQRGHTFGLRSMHERAVAVGGELNVTSKQGEGTAIIVYLRTV